MSDELLQDEVEELCNDIFFPYNLDKSIICDAIEEMSHPIEDKDRFYADCILNRLQSCSKIASDKFSEALDDVMNIDMNKALERKDFREINKIIRYTNKVTSKMHRGLLQLLKHLQSN